MAAQSFHVVDWWPLNFVVHVWDISWIPVQRGLCSSAKENPVHFGLSGLFLVIIR